ncbi:putative MFS family arabinose efflux permease [Tamaricihabitans halophyticus]|uniref:Putative MFS family arabinose efflux permease n=1 Tax=Tamaricihabitans halophyticus TaxID=1262583 RepID=A0A4V2SV89_9PSEU|nr:MFS transporter [Tamaricihabitans halophyticus]TCP57546.1 putative MFS family arabinose efflux permease [Tamaricihabitans halophyticus]
MVHERLGVPFWRFWGACVLANLGDGIRVAAFPLLAASLTNDPALVALVGAAAALPWLLTGLLAGSLADRRSARYLLLGADTARVAVLAALVIALVTDSSTIALTAAVAFALGVAETVRDTTAQVVVPRLVPQRLLERANGRMVSGEVVGNEFVGPLVGSALFAAGAALPFAANSASLAVAVLLVLSLPASLIDIRPGESGEAPVRQGLRAGLGWVARHRVLRGLIVAAALVALADAAWFAIFVLYVQDHLYAGPLGFGAYLAVGAAGGLLGALMAERLIAARRHRGVLLGSMAVTAVTPALLLLAPTVAAAVVVVVATSAGFGVLNVAAVSVRQRLTPAGLLGRVTAAWRTIVLGAGALGALCGGAVASWQGLHAPFAFSAVLGLLAVALWWLSARGGLSLGGPAAA